MLQSLLAEGRPLLADGATGTNLFAMGLTSGDSPELWNAEHPDRIESLHRSFVDAGSDIILTNSFGANRRRLMLHKLEGRTRELNRLAAEIARKVADSAGRPRRRRRISRADGRPPCSARTVERRRGGRRLHRADRGPARRRRGRRLDRDHVGAGGNARGGGRGGQVRHALYGHRQLRHRRPHHDGRCARGVQRSCPSFRPGACRLWRELRRRRLRPPGGDPWDGARRDADRQGQRRRAAMAWGGNPLFRHAGADGELRRVSRRIAARASSAAAAATRPPMWRRCGAASTPAKPARVRTLEAIVAALGPLVAPPAAETGAGRPRRRERT